MESLRQAQILAEERRRKEQLQREEEEKRRKAEAEAEVERKRKAAEEKQRQQQVWSLLTQFWSVGSFTRDGVFNQAKWHLNEGFCFFEVLKLTHESPGTTKENKAPLSRGPWFAIWAV